MRRSTAAGSSRCSGHVSSSSLACWKVPREARMDPPIHTLYRRSTVLVGDTTCGKAEGGQEWLRHGVG